MTAWRSRTDRNRSLQQMSLFSGCTNRDMRRVASLTTVVEVEHGKVLTQEGQAGVEFFVVTRGTAAASREGRWIGEFGPGSFFGEVALLGDGLRTATVVAETDMSLLVSTRAEFWSLYTSVPRLAQNMSAEHQRTSRKPDELLRREPGRSRLHPPVVLPAMEG